MRSAHRRAPNWSIGVSDPESQTGDDWTPKIGDAGMRREDCIFGQVVCSHCGSFAPHRSGAGARVRKQKMSNGSLRFALHAAMKSTSGRQDLNYRECSAASQAVAERIASLAHLTGGYELRIFRHWNEPDCI